MSTVVEASEKWQFPGQRCELVVVEGHMSQGRKAGLRSNRKHAAQE